MAYKCAMKREVAVALVYRNSAEVPEFHLNAVKSSGANNSFYKPNSNNDS
jgi:hypothetical protein